MRSARLPRRATALVVGALALLLLSLPAAGQREGEEEQDQVSFTEKELISDFTKAFKAKDPSERSAAISVLGDMSRELEDKGTSKKIAKAIGKGLGDDSLEVRNAAILQLSWGRHVDTVIGEFKGMISDQRKEVDKRTTRTDDESKAYVRDGTRTYHQACWAVSNYKDDRVVELLRGELQSLRKNTAGYNLSTRLVGRLANSLLDLGSMDAWEAAVQHTGVYTGTYQDGAARALHEALSEYAVRAGQAPPEYTDLYYVAWDDWFEEHAEKFPKKLGKLKEPPVARPYERPDDRMFPDPEDGGPAPR